MSADDPLFLGGAAPLLDDLRARRRSVVEVAEAHIARAEALDPALRLLVCSDPEGLRRRARALDDAGPRGDAPLWGLPMTIKDMVDVAGMRTTIGQPPRFVPLARETGSLVRRLEAAGAMIWAKSSLPFAAYDWQSKHSTRGIAANPWDPTRTVGGSSGGAAAAVAAGISPLEVGSDVAGSIRVPCHYCGVYGLRMSEGAPFGVEVADMPGPRTMRHLAVMGPITRRAADLGLLLDVLQDRNHGPLPKVQVEGGPEGLAGLRVAATAVLGGVRPSAATLEVHARCLRALEGAGAIVEEVTPDLDYEEAMALWGLIQGYEMRWSMPPGARRGANWLAGLVLRWHLGPGPMAPAVGRGFRASPVAYFAALQRRDQLLARWRGFWARHDLWITPTAASPAFRHCRSGAPIDVDDRQVGYVDAHAAYNCTTTLLAHPILCAPAGRSPEGLPIGLQLHARWGADRWLCEVAERWEALLGPPPAPPLERLLGQA